MEIMVPLVLPLVAKPSRLGAAVFTEPIFAVVIPLPALPPFAIFFISDSSCLTIDLGAPAFFIKLTSFLTIDLDSAIPPPFITDIFP